MAHAPLVDYDPRWPIQFGQEKARILSAIGSKVVAIEHYGSTAVPGLEAKPVIDILIAVHHLDDVNEFIEPLRELGYEYRPINEVLILGTRYFRRGASGANTHHIRVVEAGSDLWRQYLLFRDYLRGHLEEARRYAQLKRELQAKFGQRLPLDAKKSYIKTIIARARDEKSCLG